MRKFNMLVERFVSIVFKYPPILLYISSVYPFRGLPFQRRNRSKNLYNDIDLANEDIVFLLSKYCSHVKRK